MKVDYAAMLDTVYKKAAARKKRTAFVKYGSMAAAAAIMFDHNDLDRLLRTKPHYGFRAAWAYRTVLGPVGASLNYNTRQKEVSLYVNLGYEF